MELHISFMLIEIIAIIAGIIGGILLIALVCCCCCCWHYQSKDEGHYETGEPLELQGNVYKLIPAQVLYTVDYLNPAVKANQSLRKMCMDPPHMQ